jgi:SET domain-containing protein
MQLNDLAHITAATHARDSRYVSCEEEAATIRAKIMAATDDYGLSKAVVRTSPVHGCGVFAQTNITQGDLITLYPCDVLKRGAYTCAPGRFHNEFSILDTTTRQARFVKDSTYTVDINHSESIIGVPTFSDDNNYIGHLINDSALVRSLTLNRRCGRNARKTRGVRAARAYTVASCIGANCRFRVVAEGLMTGVEATRDITAGDELFVSYGVGYWRHQ